MPETLTVGIEHLVIDETYLSGFSTLRELQKDLSRLLPEAQEDHLHPTTMILSCRKYIK